MKYLLIVFFLVIQLDIFGQEFQEGTQVICEAGENFDGPISSLSSYKNLRTQAGVSSFVVTYSGFPSDAKAAFQAAIDVWQKVMVTRVPIRIKASWESINSTTLANSGATKVYKNFGGNSIKDVWYPVALAEAIAGKELNGSEADINITVNQNISWSYFTDGTRQAFKYDLMTVILHEIAHGLGFTTTMKIGDSNTLQGQYGQSGTPFIYDMFIQNGSEQKMTDAAIFGNPSADLKTNYTSNNLFFNIKDLSLISEYPKIYAPSTFRSGGSISHLDENKFPKGTPNALMSPQIGAAEINHFPGPIILAILNEIGWSVNFYDLSVITAIEPVNVSRKLHLYPNPVIGAARVIVPDEMLNADLAFYLVDAKGSLTYISSNATNIGANTFEFELSNLSVGKYFIKAISAQKELSVPFIKY